MQRNQDIVDTGIEIEGGRQRPGPRVLVVEKNMVAAVVIAIRREQVEYRAPVAFYRLLCSAQPAAEAHEIFVINGAIGGLAVHHAAEGMHVPPADGLISPAVTVKTFDREMPALAVVDETGPGQADAGVLRHQPEGKFHRALGFIAGPGEFQDAGAISGRRSAPDENLVTLDEFPFQSQMNRRLGVSPAQCAATLGQNGIHMLLGQRYGCGPQPVGIVGQCGEIDGGRILVSPRTQHGFKGDRPRPARADGRKFPEQRLHFRHLMAQHPLSPGVGQGIGDQAWQSTRKGSVTRPEEPRPVRKRIQRQAQRRQVMAAGQERTVKIKRMHGSVRPVGENAQRAAEKFQLKQIGFDRGHQLRGFDGSGCPSPWFGRPVHGEKCRDTLRGVCRALECSQEIIGEAQRDQQFGESLKSDLPGALKPPQGCDAHPAALGQVILAPAQSQPMRTHRIGDLT